MLSIDLLNDLAVNRDTLTPYGIPFLDDALHGISRNELVVIGSHTGVGKTELLTNIALNASKTKKVIFFALEAEPREIEHRLTYRELCTRYFALTTKPKLATQLQYSNYRLGLLGNEINELITDSADAVEKLLANLTLVYAKDLTVESFVLEVQAHAHLHDLWIIDHLHYFEWGDDELKGVRDLMKAVRKVGVDFEVPLVFACHLRKKDRFASDFPELAELHGSSEISKRATTVILLGEPKRGKFQLDGENKSPTVLHVAKCRHEGALRHWYGLHMFDFYARSYSPTYYVLERKKGEFEGVQDKRQMPKWCTNGIALPTEVSTYERY